MVTIAVRVLLKITFRTPAVRSYKLRSCCKRGNVTAFLSYTPAGKTRRKRNRPTTTMGDGRGTGIDDRRIRRRRATGNQKTFSDRWRDVAAVAVKTDLRRSRLCGCKSGKGSSNKK